MACVLKNISKLPYYKFETLEYLNFGVTLKSRLVTRTRAHTSGQVEESRVLGDRTGCRLCTSSLLGDEIALGRCEQSIR